MLTRGIRDDNPEKWAAQILGVTRIEDADGDVNARQITNVLGQRAARDRSNSRRDPRADASIIEVTREGAVMSEERESPA